VALVVPDVITRSVLFRWRCILVPPTAPPTLIVPGMRPWVAEGAWANIADAIVASYANSNGCLPVESVARSIRACLFRALLIPLL
jgi:hypothetical protein